ncbi:DUF3592 domain-containing protein [Coraliomargarita parva]|uniref:DUF3592 domain-containing protein n=1 Tax=Coraliomargarita parva TaxID=3014050 RepID=UPI0022B5180E|nr:DUF3592 domain-containing protein [Coraliomargarita parva]
MRLRVKSKPSTNRHEGAGFRDAPSSKKGRFFGVFFGFPFFAMGAAFCWFMALHPIVKSVTSGDWPQVRCVITKSYVDSHSDSDGTTYSIEIEFRYRYEGNVYTGGSYDFNTASSSGSSGKHKVVRQYPVGSEQTCWVNPSDPTEAVLSRKIPGIVYLVIPFTSIFMLIGLAIMLGSLGLLPPKWRDKLYSRHKPVEDQDEGERWLKPKHSGTGKLIGAIFIAAFWNGITGVFVGLAVKSFLEGRPEWFLTLFIIPFVCIGLVLFFSIFYYLVALFNPKVDLNLSEARPRLGQTVRLNWRSRGSLQRLKDLEIILEGRESATYRRGTNSVTDHSLFHKETLFKTEQPGAHPGGQIDLQLPTALMHSFDGGNNKIEWRIRIVGSIPRWPDIDENYPITVRRLKHH